MMQQYKQQNGRVHNTICAYMDTKGRMCRHLHCTNKTKKLHLINTMSVHGIIWRRVGYTEINRTSILRRGRNRFGQTCWWLPFTFLWQQHGYLAERGGNKGSFEVK